MSENQPKTAPSAPVIKIRNENMKLQNEWFLDIAKAPSDGFTWDRLPARVTVTDIEGVVPPFDAEITAFIRYPIMHVPELYCRMATGKSPHEVGGKMMIELGLNEKSEVAVYLYHRLSF